MSFTVKELKAIRNNYRDRANVNAICQEIYLVADQLIVSRSNKNLALGSETEHFYESRLTRLLDKAEAT